MQIFKKSKDYLAKWPKILKTLEIAIKALFILILPLPVGLGFILLWKYLLFDNGIYFMNKMEPVLIAWIGFFAILYSLLVVKAIDTVWGEYKTMRLAAKQWDIDTFMDLRDEELSPLFHIIIGICALGILGAFMSIEYPSFSSGAVIIGGTAYFLTLIFIIVKEIDNPCSGFWFIKNIPKLWLEIDPKVWREKRAAAAKKIFEEKCASFEIILKIQKV